MVPDRLQVSCVCLWVVFLRECPASDAYTTALSFSNALIKHEGSHEATIRAEAEAVCGMCAVVCCGVLLVMVRPVLLGVACRCLSVCLLVAVV